MKRGDTVSIYPHGSPKKAAIATVIDVGEKAVALEFREWPLFAIGERITGPVFMYLMRYDIGPWFEIGGGGHYEIEEG